MKYRHFQKIVRAVTLVSLAFLLATEPVMVAAKTLEKDPHAETVNLLLNGGDAYLDSASNTIVGSMELLGYLNTIHSTPLNQVSESYVSDVIDRALTVAEQSSIALGSVNVMADGIEQLGGTFPAAMNLAEAAGAGIPQEMRDDLSGLGIPNANIDQVSASASDLLSRRQTGIPAGMQSDLLGFGFTQSQIDQLALALSERGLANDGLTTRLAQLRATRDELSDTRTGMVILAVQLLGYQIAARQIDGIAPRSITDDELQALADDELRLLVHAAHLNAMWGSDPSSEIGEGDWWFIEHYAGRAAERLEAVTVESQNRSLTAELFVLYQMKMLAISARTGDAEYAQAELTGLAALLSHHLNATSYYEKRLNPGLAERVWARAISAPALRERVEWSIPRWAAKNSKLIMQEQINSTVVENLAVIIGGFDESNEANNTGGLLIVAGLSFFDQIEASVVTAAVQIISSATPENTKLWLVAILTGDTDNPALLTANVVLSLIPVIGVIPDLATLAVDPSIFVKALSIFGIIGSIGDILALIPGLQGVGGASFVGDAVATVVKTLFKQADGVFRAVLNGLKLADAFDVVADLVKTVVRIVAGSLGGSLSQVINTITNIFTGSRSLWGDFVAFVRRAGANTLLKLGFDEGSALVGRILNLGTSLSDEALEATQKIGREFAEASIELSDNAAKGLGDAVDILGETKARQLFSTCIAGNFTGHAKFASMTLSPLHAGLCDEALEIFGSLSRNAKQGFNKIPVEKLNEILTRGESLNVLNRTGEIFGNVRLPVGRTISNDAVEGSLGLVSRNLDSHVTNLFNYGFDAGNRSLEIIGTSTVVWDADHILSLGKVLQRDGVSSLRATWIDNLKNIDGINRVVFDLGQNADSAIKGANFHLEYASSLGANRIQTLEDMIDSKKAADIILIDNTIIDAKFRTWIKYGKPGDFIFDQELAALVKQAGDHARRYPGAPIHFVFDGRQGPVPSLIRETLEDLGVFVDIYP